MGDDLIENIESLFNSLDAQVIECRSAHTDNFSKLTMEFDMHQRLATARDALNASRARFLDKLKKSLEEKLEECKRLWDSEKDVAKTKSDGREMPPRTKSEKVEEASSITSSERDQNNQRRRENIATIMLKPVVTPTYFVAYSATGIQNRVNKLRDQVLSEIAFTPMQIESKSIYIGCFVDLVYKNPFSLEQKVDYWGLYASTLSSFELDFFKKQDFNRSNWIVMPISRNRLFHYNRSTGVLSILDSKLRTLFSKKSKPKKIYQNFKVYGRRIVATGMMHEVEGLSENLSKLRLFSWYDVFVDIYDLSLSLKATKKFGLVRRDLGGFYKLERVSKDIFMHRYSPDEEVYTLFDFKLNIIIEHRTPLQTYYDSEPRTHENMRTRYEPFFYDGEKVEKLTARHLYLLIHSPNEMAERKKRLLNLYTSQEIKWEHMQEANKIDGRYFDYKMKPQTFLIFNLDRDTFNYVWALTDSSLRSDRDSYNWITVDERYKGGLTESGDLFSIGDNGHLKFI